jgi:HlyD family secretion protein
LTQAEAQLRLSEAQLKRQERLVASRFTSRETLDEARAARDQDRARIVELKAQLATARLAAREDEIRAAEAEVAAAKAALAQAEWRVDQRSVRSSVEGQVTDTLYVRGEWVPAGSPVVELLPPANIKLRFFVPEPELGAIRLQQPVSVTCDGCPAPIPARITFIAPEAEYTPPVIYSRESREKLVFLVEAHSSPEDAVKLHPGQPVEVRLQPQ